MLLRVALFLLLAAGVVQAAEIKGKVTNAVGGEVLGRVQVVILETRASAVTSADGEFAIGSLAPGKYTLRLNAVSYRLLTVPFTLASADEVKEFSITLVPDNFHHTDKVEVRGDVFQGADSPATNQLNLTSSEIREASTVFADDPFRAVQAMPGVSASGNNEFFAEFSVMGAPFSSVSIYLDDVLVRSPFHEIGSFNEGASLGVLTSEVVEEMKLMPAAYPVKFGDAIGAALDVRTREGSRGTPLFRFSAGIAASDFLAEGGLGGSRKGSWLVSARKSYINYLVRDRVKIGADVGFYDGDLKLNYDLTPRQNLNLYAVTGHTNISMTHPESLTPNDYASGTSDFTLARLGWRWSVSPRLLVDARGAYLRQPEQLVNTAGQVLTSDYYHEWVGGAGITWAWAKNDLLEAGWTARRLAGHGFFAFYDPNQNNQLQVGSEYDGTGLRQSGYVQQASSFLGERVHALAGVRWDSLQPIGVHPFSPQVSLAIRATRSTQVQFAAGRYAQFPDFSGLAGVCVPIASLIERSNHYTAGIEQRIGEQTRLRVQAFDRQDVSLLGFDQSWSVMQQVTRSCPPLQPVPGVATLQRDYSRGVQVVLQRRSANRLSGWLGYTWTQARQRQYTVAIPEFPSIPDFPTMIGGDTPYYPTLEDQRHSLNLLAIYRLTPTINLSGKFLYGSGFPVPSGTYVLIGNTYQPVGLNETRLDPYARLDVRVDKDWAFKRWKLTLYGEVLNLTNHYNGRYSYSSVIDPNTGQTQVKTLQGLPITPTAGVVFQF